MFIQRPKHFTTHHLFIGLLSAALALSGCGPKSTPEVTEEELKSLVDVTCTQNSQCGVMPYGYQVCGNGPRAYVFYSSLNTDVALLTQNSQALVAQEKEKNKNVDCSKRLENPIRLPVKFVCLQEKCQEAPAP